MNAVKVLPKFKLQNIHTVIEQTKPVGIQVIQVPDNRQDVRVPGLTTEYPTRSEYHTGGLDHEVQCRVTNIAPR